MPDLAAHPTPTPIHTLSTDTLPPPHTTIHAIVTLSWPYSSSTQQSALLLADPDFRLRHRRGQVRVRFTGPSAVALARTHVQIGDVVDLRLDGAAWGPDAEAARTPGRSVEGELVFRRKVWMSVARENGDAGEVVEVDEREEEEEEEEGDGVVVKERIFTTPAPKRSEELDYLRGSSQVYDSPAFLKRRRLPGDLGDLDSWYDPFMHEMDEERLAKRRKISLEGLRWRHVAKSPSPTLSRTEPRREVLDTGAEQSNTSRLFERHDEITSSMPISSQDLHGSSTQSSMLPPPLPKLQMPTASSFEDQASHSPSDGPLTPKLQPVESSTLPLPSPFPVDHAHSLLEPSYMSRTDALPLPTTQSPQYGSIGGREQDLDRDIEDTHMDVVHDDEVDEVIAVSQSLGPSDEESGDSEDEESVQSQLEVNTRTSPTHLATSGAQEEPNEGSPIVSSQHVTPQSEKDKVMARTLTSLFGFKAGTEDTPEPEQDADDSLVSPASPTPAANLQITSQDTGPQTKDEEPSYSTLPLSLLQTSSSTHEAKRPMQPSGPEIVEILSSPESVTRPQMQDEEQQAQHDQFAATILEQATYGDDAFHPNAMNNDVSFNTSGVETQNISATETLTSDADDFTAHVPTWESLVSQPFTETGPEALSSHSGTVEYPQLPTAEDPTFADASFIADSLAPPSDSHMLSAERSATEPGERGSVSSMSNIQSVLLEPQSTQAFEDAAASRETRLHPEPTAQNTFDLVDWPLDSNAPIDPRLHSVDVKEHQQSTDPNEDVHTIAETATYPTLPLSPSLSQLLDGTMPSDIRDSFRQGDTVQMIPLTPQQTQLPTLNEGTGDGEESSAPRAHEGTVDAPEEQQQAREAISQSDTRTLDGEMGSVSVPTAKGAEAVSAIDGNSNAAGEHPAQLNGDREPPTTVTKQKTPARKSQSNRPSIVPDVIKDWFTPRRSSRLAKDDTKSESQESNATDSTLHPEDGMTLRNGHTLGQTGAITGFATSMAYFTPLAAVSRLVNPSSQNSFSATNTIDTFAVVLEKTKEPQQAKLGAKDYFTIFRAADMSLSVESSVRVEVFRPWKATLPVAEVGDVVLLRAFVVKSRKRLPYLLSTDTSAWCVWRYDNQAGEDEKPVWARRRRSAIADGSVHEEVKGPPVEFGDEERMHVDRLRQWWLSVRDHKPAE